MFASLSVLSRLFLQAVRKDVPRKIVYFGEHPGRAAKLTGVRETADNLPFM